MKSIVFAVAVAVMVFAGALQGQSTRITVIDATTREPLTGAVVLTGEDREALLMGREGPGQARVAGTAGVFDVRQIGPAGTVMARVSAPDHSSILVDYPQGGPKEVTVPLPRAVRVGGVVVNEKGEPVKGAALEVIAFAEDLPRFLITGEWSRPVTTDEQGRFTLESAPERLSGISIQSNDPRFAPQMMNSGEGAPDVAAFKAGTARLVLREGQPMTGIVVDAQDQPVAGAEVLAGTPQDLESLRRTTTDAAGRFRIEQIFTEDVKQYPVIARLPGKAVGGGRALAAQTENVRIKLLPTRSVSGKVVDAAGKPVRASVVAADAAGLVAIQPQVRSDAEGAFTIDQIPTGALQFITWAPGYQTLTSTIAESAGPVTLTLRQLPTRVRLTGMVVDDETGAPVPAFEVAAGMQHAANQPLSANRRERATFTNGAFEVVADEHREYFAYFVRVEVPGYAHHVTTPLKLSELPADRVVKFDIRLKRADPIRARVIDSEGRPVLAARVTLGVETAEAWISNERTESDKSNIWTVPDKFGEFQLPSQGGKEFTLIATNDRGVGLARHSDPRDAGGGYTIKIDRHWGRVEGRYFHSGLPVKGGIINAQLSSLEIPPFVVFNVNGKTDDQGRFAFDQMIPGRHRMSLRPNLQTGDGSQSLAVDVRPDETRQVEVGTSGRNVKGKFEISARGQVEWFTYIDRIGPPVTLPGEFNASLDVARQFLQKLRQDPEFAQWRAEQQSETPVRGIRIPTSPDGSFQFGLLAPGFYRLTARASEPAPQSNVRQAGAQIGEIQYGLVVPAESGGVIDLQAIPLKITSSLRAGDPVPAVEGKLLDGTPFSMAGLKGKYVVINFWATWCGPCKFEMPAVKAIHDEFATRGDVVVVGMCLDETIPPAAAYATENQYAWQHVFLGNWQATDVPEKFGVRGIPTTVLVGPDGKVIAAAAQAAEVHRGLTELLSKPK